MGVGILYDAGYDPRAMPEFFETIQQKYGEGSAQFLSDHPNPGNRSEYVDKEIATFVPRSNYVTNTPAFTRMHQEVAGMHAYTAQEVASGVWKGQSPNQTVSTGVNQLDDKTSAAAAPDLRVSSTWKSFRGSDFSIRVPDNWKALGNTGAAMFAPPGGVNSASAGRTTMLAYGVLTDVYQPPQQLSSDQVFDALLSEVMRDNPGLECGRPTAISAGGSPATSVECENRSANNGRGEHDWMVGFQRNGAIRYFVFVAPTTDFPTMKPTFENILRSITFQ